MKSTTLIQLKFSGVLTLVVTLILALSVSNIASAETPEEQAAISRVFNIFPAAGVMVDSKPRFPAYPASRAATWDSTWGHFYDPNEVDYGLPNQMKILERKPGEKAPLRLVLFVSYLTGHSVLKAMIHRQQTIGDIEIVGVATDEVDDTNAKISENKRFWSHFSEEQQRDRQMVIEHTALTHGIPVYSGQVKSLRSIESRFFISELLPEWNPDLILMTGFGQMLNSDIINFPRLGTYNTHPSDVVDDQVLFKGADPFLAMKEHKRQTTVLALHEVTEGIDEGKVLDASSPISLVDEVPALVHCEDFLTAQQYISVREFLIRSGAAAAEVAERLIDRFK